MVGTQMNLMHSDPCYSPGKPSKAAHQAEGEKEGSQWAVQSHHGGYLVVDVTKWKRVMVNRVERVRDMTGKNLMTAQAELALVPSPFEEAQSELALVPVNGGGNGDGENQKAFGCSVEGQKNCERVSVEFWKMWAK